MSCTQTLNGIAKDCSPNLGGVRRVYISNWEDVSFAADATTGVVTVSVSGEGGVLQKYEFPRGLASMTSTATIEATSGAKYYTTEVALQFNKMEATKRLEMTALAMADLAVIVEDENGKLWLPDTSHPMSISAGDGTTGTAVGDANKYGITLQVVSAGLPYEVAELPENAIA